MLYHLFSMIDFNTGLLLGLALLFVLFYEAINGFHDTANAVAIVVYTRAMHSQLSVLMAGLFNFFGVLLGGLSVAYTIVHLFPTDLLLNASPIHGLAMIFSMLFAAIIWNLGTWYFGLPASSSHTLIGAIIGIGITNALVIGTSVVDALNISKIISVFSSLILSPIISLVISSGLIFFLRRYWIGTKKRRRIHMTPADRERIDGKKKPPFWTRVALIFTAIGLSYSHGANDGQKGIGLIMLVLISIVPSGFVINMHSSGYDIMRTRDAINHLKCFYQKNNDMLQNLIQLHPIMLDGGKKSTNILDNFYCDSSLFLKTINHTQQILNNLSSYNSLSEDQRIHLRRFLICITDTIEKITKIPEISAEDKRFLSRLGDDLLNTIEYAPIWIIIAVALSLSLGTMVGWRRIATTIGEKIGKKSLTYGQGISAQVTSAIFIGIASYTEMPVSTTHILSSSVTGAILADGGGIQSRTIKNIALAWVFTLPISILLSSCLYWVTLKLI